MSTDNWTAKLAADLPKDSISWRQDGKPTQRDGKYVARFVAYTDAQVVRERLDAVVPGEWDLTLELLPHASDADGEATCAFKARLQILGVIREDVGTGSDYKSAATDAFKRAAVRFGIGHELYSMGQVWVQVDGDGKYAKPLEDPATVYARKASGVKSAHTGMGAVAPHKGDERSPETAARENPAPAPTADEPAMLDKINNFPPPCPKCGGAMWDNRASKRNPKAPNAKCRNRACDGVIWPEKKAPVAAHNAGPLIPDGPPPEYEEPVDDMGIPF